MGNMACCESTNNTKPANPKTNTQTNKHVDTLPPDNTKLNSKNPGIKTTPNDGLIEEPNLSREGKRISIGSSVNMSSHNSGGRISPASSVKKKL